MTTDQFTQHLGNVDDLVAGKRARAHFRPPPKLTLSEWADLNFYLSPESSAQAGRWTTLPYQKELLDAMTDPRVTHVSVMKSARVGFTKCMNALIGYHIHHAPCPILVVQPTIEDAKGYSKEEIAPMIRDCPALSAIVFKDSEETTGPVKDSANTLLHKALALDTPIPTPAGWTTVGAVQAGDFVFDERGTPTRVSHVTPVYRERPCFRVHFSDGSTIVADAEHRWAVEWWRVDNTGGVARQAVEAGVLTTEQIAARVRQGGRHKYSVRNAGALELPHADLQLDPYVLGAWLGDGLSHRAWVVSGYEDAAEMRGLLEGCGHRVDARKGRAVMTLVIDRAPAVRGAGGRMQRAASGAIAALRTLGVLGTTGDSRKQIPPQYLRASVEQRIALLQGLMDTDGHVRARDGLCVLTTSSPALAAGYGDLLSGLGVKWVRRDVTATYRHKGEKCVSPKTAFRFEFYAAFAVFRLRRKLERQSSATLRSCRRRIVAVECTESVPVKCITVDAASHLFLAGDRMIPTHNSYPGGLLSLAGANSGTGFRRVSRKIVCLDEVDAYPPSAGADGDPVKLATKRTEYYHDRKIVAGSTPLITGHSRIEELFEAGDQRRYFVPCPHCGAFDILVFSERAEGGGHYMVFDPKDPAGAHFVCSANGCVIEHHHKRDMVARGEWRAAKPFTGHASFHIWAAYSFSPNATWGQLAAEFLEAKKLGREALKTFVNTALGETWKETGEAPEWERLYQRREHYPIGSVPEGVKFVTVGVDVQKDRWVYEVVGWAAGRKSWSIDAGVIPGKTENEAEWTKLDELLDRKYLTATGLPVQALMLAIDSGYQTQMVYWWARRHRNVIATKGVHTQHAIVGSPTPVDIRMNGGRIANGCKVWPVGASKAKEELYGWLRMQAPTDGSATPNGWCAFPEHGEDFFKQLCGEQLVSTTHKRTGVKVHEWQVIPGRENHWLDARIAARVAAAVLGLDRLAMPAGLAPAVAAPAVVTPAPPVAAPPRPQQTLTDSRFTGRRSGGWLSKR